MSSVRPSLQALPPGQQRRVARWLDEFGKKWDEWRLAKQIDRLPPPGSILRAVLLTELVKIDLARQWGRGRGARLESYLARFPELGTAESVDEQLVRAECDVLCGMGISVDWQQVAQRFPRQAERLRAARLCTQPTIPPVPWNRASLPPPDIPSSHALHSTTQPPLTTSPVTGISPGPCVPEIFGRYRIKRRLARGGMGTVYLAHDTTLDRRVALKVPLVDGDNRGEWLERFYREARAAAGLRHPNLCPVYDVGEIDGTPYLTMAYIKGHSLAKFVGRAQPPSMAASIVRKIALALAEAHRHGVLHRDLKPANVMIDRRHEPIVMDFGLAQRRNAGDARLTHGGTILGTPAYMPPEQVRGDLEDLKPACDVYSLGVILYELLCGRPPFEGPTAVVFSQILSTEPAAPSRHNAGVDPKLEAICLKAMAKRVSKRYRSMADFAAALTNYLRTTPQQRVAARRAVSSSRKLPHDAGQSQRRWLSLAALGCAGVVALFATMFMMGPHDPTLRADTVAARDATANLSHDDVSPASSAPKKPPKKNAAPQPARKEAGKLFVSASRAVSLRPGQHMSLEVRIKRQHLRGPVELSVTGLPREVTGNSAVVSAKESDARLDLIAAGDAEPVSAKALIVASLGDSEATTDVDVSVVPVQAAAGTTTAKPPNDGPDESARAKREPRHPKELRNSIDMKLVLIPAGDFMMGSDESLASLQRTFGELPPDQRFSNADEHPRHQVRITRPFYLGTYEVTRAQFARFVQAQEYYTDAERDAYGGNGWDPNRRALFQGPLFSWRYTGFAQGDDSPVVNVSWNDAQAFCAWLSAKEGRTYRLPTEAEWEYACRAGTTTHFYNGDQAKSLVEIGNVADATASITFVPRFALKSSDGFAFTAPVGSFQPNAFGLYDMLGNVWEWCADWYGANYYAKSPAEDPPGPVVGLARVARGGSFADPPVYDRCSRRACLEPMNRYCGHGFRVVCESKPP